MGCQTSRHGALVYVEDSIHLMIAKEERRLAQEGKSATGCHYRPRSALSLHTASSSSASLPPDALQTTRITVTEEDDEEDEQHHVSLQRLLASQKAAVETSRSSPLSPQTHTNCPILAPSTSTRHPVSPPRRLQDNEEEDWDRLRYHTAHHNHTVDPKDWELVKPALLDSSVTTTCSTVSSTETAS